MAASSISTTSSQLPLISLCETVAKINMPTVVQANSVVPSSNVISPSLTSGDVFKLSFPTGEIQPLSTNTVAKIVPTMATLTVSRAVEIPASQKPIIVTVSGMQHMGGSKQLTTVTNVVTTPLLSAPVQMISPHFTTEKLQCSPSVVTLPTVSHCSATSGPVVVSAPLQGKPKNVTHMTPIIPGSLITSKSLGQLPVVIGSSSFLTNSANTMVTSSVTPQTLPATNIVTVTPVIMTSGAPVVSISANSAITVNHSVSNQAQVVTPVIQGAVKNSLSGSSKAIVPTFIKSLSVANNSSSLPLLTSSAALCSSIVNGFNPKSDPLNPDFDPIHVMEWKDGVGALPGSDIKFKMNEFGTLEIINEENESSAATGVKNEASIPKQKPENQAHQSVSESEMSVRNGLKENFSKMKEMYQTDANSVADQSIASTDSKSDISSELCRCENCDCFGLKVEFCNAGRFCSQACVAAFSNRKNSLLKRGASKEARKRKRRKSSSSDDEEDLMKDTKEKACEAIVKCEEEEGSPVAKLFCWTEYLHVEKTEMVPLKCFNDSQNFPISLNGFEIGMKLEAIDPKHPSLFCVVAVAEVRGYRLRLHFDGFSERYDFWVNANSPDIFPVGWCEKTGRKLQAPKGFTSHEFSWESYLQLSLKFVAAPRHLFIGTEGKNSHGFRVGMKLEAVDKKNSLLVCVATIADIIENRLLIHFDGWEDIYDYWIDCDSSLIHPIDWCDENGHDLVSPKDYKGDSFCWSRYLAETKSIAASFRLFRQSAGNSFCTGLKLEAVDKRNPRLIRVATVSDKNDNSLLIHFDGWSNTYDYWVDYDCPDIHPVNWCHKTGHPLEPPIGSTVPQLSSHNGCPTTGCSGFGHIKGPKHTTHHSSFGCPYSHLNLNKIDSLFQDRVTVSKDVFAESKPKLDHSSTTEGLRRCPTPGCNGAGHVKGKYSVHHGVSGCPLAAQQDPPCLQFGLTTAIFGSSKVLLSSTSSSKALDFLRNKNFKGKKKKLFGTGLRGRPPKALVLLRAQQAAQQRHDALKKSRFAAEIYKSVFEEPFLKTDHPSSSDRITRMLPNIRSTNVEDIKSWTIQEVSKFVADLTGNSEVSKIFLHQLIDGEAFILLNQDDITNIMKIKLGCALKIFNSIVYFRWKLCDGNNEK